MKLDELILKKMILNEIDEIDFQKIALNIRVSFFIFIKIKNKIKMYIINMGYNGDSFKKNLMNMEI